MAAINQVLWDLRETYRAEQNPERRQRLLDEYDRALWAVLEITDRDIGENTVRYTKAVEGLEEAIGALKDAKQKVAGVAKAIENLAKAIDTIAKVSAKIVGA